MSAETRAELENAIAAHVVDEMDGAMVTGWVMVSSCVHSEKMESTGYFHDMHDGQAFHATAGLLQLGMWNQRERYAGED